MMSIRRIAVATIVAAGLVGPAASQVLPPPPKGPPPLPERPARRLIEATPEQRRALIAETASEAARRLRDRLRALPPERFDPAAVERAPVPILLPDRAQLLETLRVRVGRDDYTAVAREDGRLFQIYGTRQVFKRPRPATAGKGPPEPIRRVLELTPLDPAAPPRSIVNVVVQRTDYGVDVSFGRFGAVYNLSLECPKPLKDEACAEPRLFELVRSLRPVGGGSK